MLCCVVLYWELLLCCVVLCCVVACLSKVLEWDVMRVMVRSSLCCGLVCFVLVCCVVLCLFT